MKIKVKALAPSYLGAHSPAPADPSNAEHALAALKAWNDLLVARGNRLVEIAMREREAQTGREAAGRPPSPRKAPHHRAR